LTRKGGRSPARERDIRPAPGLGIKIWGTAGEPGQNSEKKGGDRSAKGELWCDRAGLR